MPRTVTIFAALALLPALATPGGAGKEAEKKPVAVFKQWSGHFPVKQQKLLPRLEAKQDVGIIYDKKTFDAVWRAWSSEDEGPIPKVDFRKYLVVFLFNELVAEIKMTDFTLTAGTLTCKVQVEQRGARPTDVWPIHMVVLPREGIRMINTGNGVFDVEPPPAEPKEEKEKKAG
jgi:hypothetical protein